MKLSLKISLKHRIIAPVPLLLLCPRSSVFDWDDAESSTAGLSLNQIKAADDSRPEFEDAV